MPKFKFAKLVRDKIVDHQLASGARPVYRRLSPQEHKQALVEKIIEEAREVPGVPPEEVVAELADIQQALDDLAEKYKVSAEDIAVAQAAKKAKNGTFKKGLFVESVETGNDDKWVSYYRQHPDRYPEIN